MKRKNAPRLSKRNANLANGRIDGSRYSTLEPLSSRLIEQASPAKAPKVAVRKLTMQAVRSRPQQASDATLPSSQIASIAISRESGFANTIGILLLSVLPVLLCARS